MPTLVILIKITESSELITANQCHFQRFFPVLGPWIYWKRTLKVLEKSLNFTFTKVWTPWLGKLREHSSARVGLGQRLDQLSRFFVLSQFPACSITRLSTPNHEKNLKQQIDAWRISLKLNFTVNCYENVIKHIYFTYLLLDKPNRSFMKKSFSYRRDYAWNTLPNEILYIHAWAIYLLSTYSF